MISYYAYPGLKDVQVNVRPFRNAASVMRSQTPEHILKKVCEFYGQKEDKVKGKARKRELVWCRFVFFHFCRMYTRMTKVDIGLYVGGRDHTTVVHGEQTLKDIIDTEPNKSVELREIEYMILFQPTIKEST
jgi:chromosomal replication initiator protein